MKYNVTRFGLALGVAAAIALSVPARAATPPMTACQNKLEKAQNAFQKSLLGALEWSADQMRTGPLDLKMADKVNKKLAGVYGTGKSVDKFRAAVDALYPTTCSDTLLSSLGFLLSGAGNPAPGATGIKFTEDYLLVEAEQDAFGLETAVSPLFWNLVLQLQQAAFCPATAFAYLCNLKSECDERVCNLGDRAASTSATDTYSWNLHSQPYNVPPASPAHDKLSVASTMNMCTMNGNITGTPANIMYIVQRGGRTLDIVDLGGGILVCVDTLRGAGFCDCVGGAGLKDITDCQDRDILRAGPGPLGGHCPNGIADPGTDNCGSPCTAGQADPSYTGDYNGLPKITAATATLAGDCVDMLTNQFLVELGANVGPDGFPCTQDDTGGVNSPTNVVLTTGHSVSSIWNAVTTYGTCSADPGVNCVGQCYNPCINKFCLLGGGTTACSPSAPCDTACNGVVYDDAHNPTASPGINGARPAAGAPPYANTACGLYQQNRLKGLSLAGTFPGSSSADAGGLGDNLNKFHMDCK